jgi:haloalkane dehalogenase
MQRLGATILYAKTRGPGGEFSVWRDMLPHVASQTGRRGVAPDLLGFGRSEKPDDVRYSPELHARVVQGFVDALDLRDIVLVADDWGGPLGMHDVVSRPERYQAASSW